MQTRRGFLKRIAAAVAVAVAAPVILREAVTREMPNGAMIEKMSPYWMQTTRVSRCLDAEYEAVFQRLMKDNPSFREFGDGDDLTEKKLFVKAFFT